MEMALAASSPTASSARGVPSPSRCSNGALSSFAFSSCRKRSAIAAAAASSSARCVRPPYATVSNRKLHSLDRDRAGLLSSIDGLAKLRSHERDCAGLFSSVTGLAGFPRIRISKDRAPSSSPRRSALRVEATATPAQVSPASESPSNPKKLFGIETTTLKKVIPLGLMFFCILFNYTILRDTKDVLVVTAKGSSAEIIPFLKTWVNLPMAIGFMLVYVTKLANVLSKEALFYSCILPFIAFFGGFAFLLYPLKDVLHPTALADSLLQLLGPSFLGPVAILRIWTFCLFYVMAELWGSVVVSVLFWGFANQITTVDEAKQFYPLFGLGANIALIFSGRTVKYFSHLRENLPPGADGWGFSLKGMMSLVVGLGLVICGIHWWVNKFVVNDPSLPKAEARKKKEKPKMGMMESFKFLLSSSYIRDLATLVVAYGISINLVEVTWKSKLKAQFPSPNDYSSFMGDFSSYTGIATFSMMLLSRYIFRKYGWGVAATITPTVLLITGVAFFGLVLCSEPLTPFLASLGMTPLLAAVYVGALQNIFSKSAKYSLFDPCKEMAYIPLDEDTKVKGKAAIDVVCNPLGKSGGALIQQFLIIGFGSLATSTPYLGGILLFIVLAWLNAARSLDKQFTPLVQKDLKGKFLEGKLSAISSAVFRNHRQKPEVTYRFVSVLNDQGFIEGRYVPVVDGIPMASEARVSVGSQEVSSLKEARDGSSAENGTPVASEVGVSLGTKEVRSFIEEARHGSPPENILPGSDAGGEPAPAK